MRHPQIVRTTLDPDDDLLQAARQLACQRGATIGPVVSELARPGLDPASPSRTRTGVPRFTPKPGAGRPHLVPVNRLGDEA